VIGDRWGVTADETAHPFPCDALVPEPALQVWRGVTVDAPPKRVWPWVRQLQLAPYSYDWIDNLGHRSPRELRQLPEPRVGEPMSRVAGRVPVGRVVDVAPGEHLTVAVMGVLMSYVLAPQGERTRLLLKVVLPRRHWWNRPLALGDLPMARKQLLTWKALAEGS
jgi:hypothetical protein